MYDEQSKESTPFLFTPTGASVVSRSSPYDEAKCKEGGPMPAIRIALCEVFVSALFTYFASVATEDYKDSVGIIAAAYGLSTFVVYQSWGDERVLLKPGLILASAFNTIMNLMRAPDVKDPLTGQMMSRCQRFPFFSLFFRILAAFLGASIGTWIVSDYKGDIAEVGGTDAIEHASNFRMFIFSFILSTVFAWIWARLSNRANNPDYLFRGTDASGKFVNQPPFAEHYASIDRSNMPKILAAFVFVSVISAGRIMTGFDPLFSQIVFNRAIMAEKWTGAWQVVLGDLLGSIVGFIPHWWTQWCFVRGVSDNQKSLESQTKASSHRKGWGRT